MSWPTTTFQGVDYWMYDGITLMPVNPGTGAAIILLKPAGGSIADGFPAIADGADGAPALFQEGPVTFTELAPGDPTPGGLTVTQVSPGLFALSGALHRGADGTPGTVAIGLAGIGGTAGAGKLIKVNAGATGFDFAYEKIAAVQYPATINSTAAGNSNSTVAIVSIAARSVDYRVRARGYQIVRQSGGSDVVVNLVARLNTEASGNVIAKCQGLGGTERLTLVDACPPGSVDAFDKVTAGNAANVYFRTEQQSGSSSYITSNSEALFVVEVLPIS